MKEADLKDQLEALLTPLVAGLNLETDAKGLAAYAASRAAFLSTLAGQIGFPEALLAERDNVALRAGIVASSIAKSQEAQLLGILQGALAIGAQALVSA